LQRKLTTAGELADEACLSRRSEDPADEMGGFGDHELGYDERLGEGNAAVVVGVSPDGCCHEWPGVDDDYRPKLSSSPSSRRRSASATLRAPLPIGATLDSYYIAIYRYTT
jgi:hypothetical protein